MSATKTPQVIAGSRPVGNCAPGHYWVTMHHEDGEYVFTKFSGWLVDEETRTTSPQVAAAVEQHYHETVR